MAVPRTQEELYEIGKNEARARQQQLTDWFEGSINDIIIGSMSVICQELSRLLVDRFNKTYFNSSEGNDLEFLATDHFGDTFARPPATKAVGVVKFSRATTSAGNVTIPSGSIVKTSPDANGNVYRFTTLSEVIMSGLEISASIEAIESGSDSNAEAGTIDTIETSLTDPSITVTNENDLSGGEPEQEDATYRDTIKRKIEELKGATLGSIQATALNVSGIEFATAKEFLKVVKEWDEGGATTIGEAFRIPVVKLYVADANGTANSALIDLVNSAILNVRAAGVYIETISAVAQNINWTANITLDVGGANYATLSNDPQPIIDDMVKYIQDLDIGEDFNRAIAEAYILSIWGSGGTGDLTDFETTIPSGNVTADDNEKLIPNTIQVI